MKTTKKHFELFKKECKYWQDRLELNNWELNYCWKDISEHGLDGASAECFDAYHATLTLDTEIDEYNLGDSTMEDSVKESAKHEVVHVLLNRLKSLGTSRYLRDGEIMKAEEELVRKLTNIIV